MGFKVGDKVEVRSDLDEDLRYNSVHVTSDMISGFAGSIVTIDKIPDYGTIITLEDGTRIYQSKEGHVVQLSTNSTLS